MLELAREHFGIAVSLEPGGALAPAMRGGRAASRRAGSIARLTETFAGELDRPFVIDTRLSDWPKRIAVYVQMDDGLLRVLAPRKRVDSGTTQVFMGWMIGLSLLLLIVSIYFLTRQLRPIRRLAWAADNFGKGRDVGDFKLEGASEIRKAGAAFNLMRKRILRHISQRTDMLAAVSHDLRTPLTRMKLELEMLAGERPQPGDLEDLRSDVEEMAGVVDGYLDFARGEGREGIVPVDLGSLLREVAERVGRERARIEVELEQPLTAAAAPGRDAALPVEPDRQRGRARRAGSASGPPSTATRSGSRSTTTARAFRRTSARRCSSRSIGSIRRAIRAPAGSGSGSPSRATSCSAMAATSSSRMRRAAACAC